MIKRKTIIGIVAILALLSAVLSLQIFQRLFFKTTSGFFRPFIEPISCTENNSSEETLQEKTKDELISELLQQKRVNKRQLARLELLNSVKRDKEGLEYLLKIKPIPGYKCIYAQIYLRDPAFWYESFSINQGSEMGIKLGCIVLSKITTTKNNSYEFAVVGRISKVSPYSSQVETIISKNCNLSVIIENSQAAGILKGGTIRNSSPSIRIAYLPLSKNYKDQDTVLTSGLCKGSEIEKRNSATHSTPSGLFIGNISGRVKIVNNLNVEAKVKPAVNFDSLKYVIVLIVETNTVRTE